MKDLREDLLTRMVQYKTQYKEVSTEHWFTAELGRWNWWISVGLTLVPIYIWWKFVDKKRILEICVYGLLVNISASFLDVIGSELLFWDYPVRLIPSIPRLVPIDFTVIPVVFMLAYQYYPKWKQFIIVNTIIAAVFAFVMEPLMIWLNLYMLFTWKVIYSFPIYIAIAVICKMSTNFFLKAQREVAKE